jgi:hypothetical protein
MSDIFKKSKFVLVLLFKVFYHCSSDKALTEPSNVTFGIYLNQDESRAFTFQVPMSPAHH